MLKLSNFKKRKRKDKNSIEARCNFMGKSLSVSAQTETELNQKLRSYIKSFNEQLKQAAKPIKILPEPTVQIVESTAEPPQDDPTFKEYALTYMKTVKKDEVTEDWYSKQMNKMGKYILPILGEKHFNEISIFDCHNVIKSARNQGYERTSEDLHNLLNQIFDYAEYDGLIRKNPMKRIKFQRHDREKGRCISYEEEKLLLFLARGTRYERYIILMLYAGLRACECASAEISEDGRFIVANNAKRKNRKIEKKFIPITPMMRPYLPLIRQSKEPINVASMRMWFYDLGINIMAKCCRHTFNTRLANFKINLELRQLAMGHRSSTVNIDTYTHYEQIKDIYFQEFQVVDYQTELDSIPDPVPNEKLFETKRKSHKKAEKEQNSDKK